MSTLKTIDHPSAWSATQLVQSEFWNLRLDEPEIEALCRIARDDEAVAFDQDPSLGSFRRKLTAIQNELENGTGVVRVTGFPADHVVEETARRAFWMLCSNIGTPISQSTAGEKIFSVRDAGFRDDDSRARGPNTRKKLSFHTDRCDVIAFLCFRQAKEGGLNQVVSSVALYNEILKTRPYLAQVLSESFLYQRHNVDAANVLPYVEQPIFSIFQGHFAANLLRVLIERAYAMPDTPNMRAEQREALDYLEAIAERPEFHIEFRQAPGDILFLNNFVTFHRRTEFVDHDVLEQKRHLFRVWLSMPNSRPLDPRFAGNYGSTEAGAIRGGMRAR